MDKWILNNLKERKDSDEIAIIHRENKETYKNLWNNSEKIALWIKDNIASKKPIIIYGNKEIEIVEIILASLKTGRAYIPIDITFPIDRVLKIYKISKSDIIFNLSDNVIDKINGINVINKDKINFIKNTEIKKEIPENNWVKNDDICYILFTSGSTGDPKGVPISKGNILNFINWFSDKAKTEGNVALNQVSYSFDVSVIQLYLYLPKGKTLFCIDKNMISDFGEMFKYLKKSNISTWVSTPSFIEMCLIYDIFNKDLLPKLEKIILAGEILTKKLVKNIIDRFPNVIIINGYGPTEGTVLLTSCIISPEMIEDKRDLPVGFILPDADYSIEKINLQNATIVSDNEEKKGELVISSKSISKGYFNNDIETNKNFSFDKKNNCMRYRTGDIVYEKNNLIYYCGRKDFQIKLNGYRIELDDIQKNINKIPNVINNVVTPFMKDGKVQYIVAFVLMKEKIKNSNLQTSIFIRKELSKSIQSYMIPKKIIILDKFPLNTNGKIDKKELMEKYL